MFINKTTAGAEWFNADVKKIQKYFAFPLNFSLSCFVKEIVVGPKRDLQHAVLAIAMIGVVMILVFLTLALLLLSGRRPLVAARVIATRSA